MVGVALALSLTTGVLFGLAPAWYCSRIDVSTMLKEGAQQYLRKGTREQMLAAIERAIK